MSNKKEPQTRLGGVHSFDSASLRATARTFRLCSGVSLRNCSRRCFSSCVVQSHDCVVFSEFCIVVALAFDYYLNILYASMSENARVISGLLEVQILRSGDDLT